MPGSVFKTLYKYHNNTMTQHILLLQSLTTSYNDINILLQQYLYECCYYTYRHNSAMRRYTSILQNVEVIFSDLYFDTEKIS